MIRAFYASICGQSMDFRLLVILDFPYFILFLFIVNCSYDVVEFCVLFTLIPNNTTSRYYKFMDFPLFPSFIS